jgi:hypothetical protein
VAGVEQLAKTFEPVCPGAGIPDGVVVPKPGALRRSVAEATPPERASKQTPIAREGMSFFISELLDSRILAWGRQTQRGFSLVRIHD